MTETELKLIAALASIGLSSQPKNGIEHAGGDGDAQRVVKKGEGQILPDVAMVGAARACGRARCRADRPSPA